MGPTLIISDNEQNLYDDIQVRQMHNRLFVYVEFFEEIQGFCHWGTSLPLSISLYGQIPKRTKCRYSIILCTSVIQAATHF